MTESTTACRKDDFHRQRSRFLDAFAELEEAMVNKSAPTDKRVTDLLKSLREIRNDLVHSQFRFAAIDGELKAIVINVQDVAKIAKPARIFALRDFNGLSARIGEVKKNLG